MVQTIAEDLNPPIQTDESAHIRQTPVHLPPGRGCDEERRDCGHELLH
jgi:hypothetical protein